MRKLKHNKFIRILFFGNYFYGLCAVALSIEAAMQQRFPLAGALFYLLVFSSTVLYYTRAYMITEVSDDRANIRSMWYARNHRMLFLSQGVFFILLIAGGIGFLVLRWKNIINMNGLEWFSLLVFPVVSALYYGVNDPLFGNHNLRNIGWLKPFIIGYTWAGSVTVYPILYYCVDKGIHYEISFVGWFLFIKNFMYITILCIMFDIKDYAMDYNQDIKTIVLKLGLRKTIFYFIIPLSIIGLASFLIYAISKDFSAAKIAINTLPFLAIITVAYSMSNRRSIFYYLVIIDGLMLFKAVCGIIAMRYF